MIYIKSAQPVAHKSIPTQPDIYRTEQKKKVIESIHDSQYKY